MKLNNVQLLDCIFNTLMLVQTNNLIKESEVVYIILYVFNSIFIVLIISIHYLR